MPPFLLAMLPGLRKALPYILLSVAIIAGYWWQARYHYGRGVEATETAWQAKWSKAEAEAKARAEALDAAYRASEADRARLAALVRNLPPAPPPRAPRAPSRPRGAHSRGGRTTAAATGR